jgi:hypothetical protein
MSNLVPNYEAAWEFLQRFHPGRLVVVTGITLDKKQIPTDTFKPDERERFIKWVAACGLMPANIYFSVGEPIQPVTRKMERSEIKAVHYLHVDLDPAAGADIAQEQTRILGLLRSPGGGLPPPTGIVYSGGGYQGYWRLKEPLAVNGVVDTAEELKLYNLQIERTLGGDNCHDVSRIMRVPGTVNVPDKKKEAKGRKPALAEVIEWHDDRVYEIGQFVKAPIVQATGGVGTGAGIGAAPKIKAPGNVRTFSHVDELGDKVSDNVKVYIVNGEDPASPGHFPSRSEMLFWVVCELTRSGVGEDDIYAVLMNRDWKISESVLEKGGGAQRYALRQIERAKEQAVDPLLREFNDRHAVIENFGGKCVVIEEILDPRLKRFRLTKQGFDHFRNRYMNREVILGQDKKGNDQTMPAGEWWLRHAQRRQYNKIVFSPGEDVPGAYNLWRGFGCEARPGDCSLFLNHIRDIACGGNLEHYTYFIAWMANVVQNPGEQGHSAVVLRGKQGSGKSIIPSLFGQLFGRHYIMVNNSKHLVGQFNAHLRDCVLLFADEAFFAGDKANESTLKTIVTEPMLQFEMKGVDAEPSANCVHLMMASNEKWVVPAGYDDRRYFVLDCLPDKVGNRAYFDDMVRQFEKQGGREALLHYLMTFDIKGSGAVIRDVPKTEALRQQKALSMDVDAEWWLNVLRRGTLLLDQDEWTDFAVIDLLVLEYLNYTKGFNLTRRGNATRMGLAMKEFVPGLKRFQRSSPTDIPQADGTTKTVGRPWCYRIPSLAECRKHFDEHFGGPYMWEGDEPPEELPDYSEVLA